jgi:hypothetical protein
VPVGTTAQPVCQGDTQIDFDHKLWLPVAKSNRLCGEGDRITLTSDTTARYVTAAGMEVALQPPSAGIGGTCA